MRCIQNFGFLILTATLAPAGARASDFFGPVPYLSSADTPAGFALGPTFIEDFEDRVIDRRLTTSTTTIIVPGSITDSVDADDGVIDGFGNGGTSLFGSNVRIDFTAPLPHSAGMVWTDGGMGEVTFEAFGPSGESLGTVGPVTLGDASISGTTAEDRFFGARDAAGISAIQFHATNVMEIDHVQWDVPVEPAIMSTLEDGSLGVLIGDPAADLPATVQSAFVLPGGAEPHGVAFLGGWTALFADFSQPVLYRAPITNPTDVATVSLPGRSSANGTLAVDPNGRYALSVGQSAAGDGEAVVIDFGVNPPDVTPITPTVRVLPFVTAAVDFAPDRRAFVCHTDGVSVLRPPYTTIDFTMPFPGVVQSPSMCRLTRDGSRLFVTRVLSESTPTLNAVRTTTAPFSAASVFDEMPAPADVQGLGPMAVSPDGQTLIVGQQFLFPPAFSGQRARAFLLRAPFDAQTLYEEIALPTEASGMHCVDGSTPVDCPGFEHIEVSESGNLAVLTGNSSSVAAGAADAAPAVFLVNPFDDGTRHSLAVEIGDSAQSMGRGTGGVRFRPSRIFADGLER